MRARVAAFALGVVATASCSQDPAATREAGAPSVLRTGEVAPDFSLLSTDGRDLALTEFRGESPVLLYFSMGPG